MFGICAMRHSEEAKRLKNPAKRRKNFGGFFATLRMTPKDRRAQIAEHEPKYFYSHSAFKEVCFGRF